MTLKPDRVVPMALTIKHTTQDSRTGSTLTIARSGAKVTITVEDRKGEAQSVEVSREDWKEITR